MRECNEDRPIAVKIPNFDAYLFAVFDGHGGSQSVRFLSEKICDYIVATPEWTTTDLANAFIHAFANIDKDLRSKVLDYSGTTATVVLVYENRPYICANVGDSRAIIATNEKRFDTEETLYALSFDHKPDLPVEYARIESAGGYVANSRVNGDLAVSRAFGDFQFKDRADLKPEEQKVIAVPDIECMLQQVDVDEFILVASDGLFDVFTSIELIAYVRSRLISGKYTLEDGSVNLLELAIHLCTEAIYRNSRDNVSVSILLLPAANIGEYIVPPTPAP
jgi:serine/threonine protein phosphatase PrpC